MISSRRTLCLFTLLTACLALLPFLSCGLSETDGESDDADEIGDLLRELYLKASDQINQTVDLLSVNLGAAAEKLGVAVETLTETLRVAADLDAAAEKLKIPIGKLREALGSSD